MSESTGNEVHNVQRLAELQALPLNRKIQITQTRIIEWHIRNNGNVYVSLSGGKDSTVLLSLARAIYPDIPAVFINTGLEYPEIREFAKSFDNVNEIRPKLPFNQVISTYGYPLIGKEVAEAIHYARRIKGSQKTSNRKKKELVGVRTAPRMNDIRRRNLLGLPNYLSEATTRSIFNKEKWLPVARDLPVMISHYCCSAMKKAPAHQYERARKEYPILGTMAAESAIRKQAWIRHGCNAFDSTHPTSQPLSFWTEQDILEYIERFHIPICSVYGDIEQTHDGKLRCTGCQRTGCVYCGFGFHLDKGETRFQRLLKTHPRLYEYSIGGGQWVDNPVYDSTASMEPDETGWINWNPKKIWTPSKEGLGMGKVFDMFNDIYGKDFYRYE